jgi:hypothetical protein
VSQLSIFLICAAFLVALTSSVGWVAWVLFILALFLEITRVGRDD